MWIVQTWEENGSRLVLRSDGVIFRWSAASRDWQVDDRYGALYPAPGCAQGPDDFPFPLETRR